MIPNVYSVADGLSLRVCRTEKFKAGLLTFSAVLPIRREETYMTSLLLSVLRRGTEKYPTLADLNRRLDYLYGTELAIRNFYRGDCQVIGFAAEILEKSYLPQDESLIEGVLDVMRQILFHPLLDEEGLLLSRYVESEKQLQCDQIRARKNHPRSYASERCRELLYEKEPCGVSIYGTEEQIMAVTAEELTAHWRALTASMRPDCFYVGSAAPGELRHALLNAFGEELTGKRPITPLLALSALHGEETCRRTEEELPVGQGQLVLGLRCGTVLTDADFYAAAVYNEMLGVSPVAKLFVHVREKLGLCYHCSSTYNTYKGSIFVSCGLDNANRAQAEEAILRQIDAMSKGEFDEEELLAAKNSLEHSSRLLQDSPAAIESYYFGRGLVGVNDSIEHCRAGFSSVTREDVVRVAEKISVDEIYFLRGTMEREEDADELD